nr:hypothetical protein [Tanacetum cinerariifolium]
MIRNLTNSIKNLERSDETWTKLALDAEMSDSTC